MVVAADTAAVAVVGTAAEAHAVVAAVCMLAAAVASAVAAAADGPRYRALMLVRAPAAAIWRARPPSAGALPLPATRPVPQNST